MRKIFVFFIFLLTLNACNDGDIITTEIEFGDTFEACGDLVLFKTKTDPNESFSLQLNNSNITIAGLIETSPDTNNPLLVNLDATESNELPIGTTNVLNFRSYTTAPINLFCNDVPPTNILVLEDFYSETGIAKFNMELIEDDNDGIPAILEDINGNGNLFDDDTDGDNLPNFLDVDDDGDNVLTASEGIVYTEGMTLAELNLSSLNTDASFTNGDTIPNYLDNDDDGDGVPTRNEEFNTLDNNPTNDVTDNTVGPDYLNELVSTNNNPPTEFREHSVNQTFIVKLVLEGIQFPNISYETFDFGTLVDPLTTSTRTIEVPFN